MVRMKRHGWIFMGYAFSFGLSLMTLWTFLSAYLRDDKKVVVYVDVWGEATVELFMLMPVMALVIIGLIVSYLDCRRKKK